jgi:surface polysaccharide O-acyltransferase-like enzyme
MTKKLVNKLKVVSFISIVLVIFIHSYNINYSEIQEESLILRFNFFTQFLISQGISRIAVPIFFAISGYLFFVNYISLKI